MQTFISENSDALSVQAADWLVDYITEVLQKQDRFTIALSGGSTPKKLFKLLAADKYINKIDWPKLHFFWGDERYVPLEDERNNARMATDFLLRLVPVEPLHIHIMQTDISPQESAVAYEKILHQYFDGHTHTFDVVMLGMGGDGHTLSLFPGYPVIDEKEKWVTSFFLKEQDMFRITLTAPVTNKAACIQFLVSGADKALALKEVMQGEKNLHRFPSQIIQPESGGLYWFIDEAAAALLD
jgi:6-phosphogluconolactonase